LAQPNFHHQLNSDLDRIIIRRRAARTMAELRAGKWAFHKACRRWHAIGKCGTIRPKRGSAKGAETDCSE